MRPPESILEDLSVHDMVLAFAEELAAAQQALDMSSLEVARAMSGQDPEQRLSFMGESVSLLELGLTPTFYQFAETTVEVRVSVSMSSERSEERSSKTTVKSSSSTTRRRGFLGTGGSTTRATSRVSSVDARYASRFQLSAEGSSMLSTRIVPVPPPSFLIQELRRSSA